MDGILILKIFNIIQILIIAFLGLSGFYIFIYAFAGLFYRIPKSSGEVQVDRMIAVLIPGYKEDNVIVEVAEDALNQNYPKDKFEVVIIADSFKPETIAALGKLPVKIVEVSFDKSTKSKALNKAMSELGNHYEIAVVLDADNLMAPDFLQKINAAFNNGFIAVQGHRTAKNMDTPLAILDAASEEINNHIFRKGHRVLGLSSAIIGSGMAFNYRYFKELMSKVHAVGGFDKEIELKMLKERHTIEYLDNALVYDEKVQKAEVFSNQRRRWLSAQFHYFRKDFLTSFWHLISKGNIDYFDKALQFIQPPRVLLLGSALILGLFFIVANLVVNQTGILLILWFTVIAIILLSFVFSVPRSFYNIQTMRSLGQLPKGMLLMLRSLLKIKGANQKFIHTEHTSIRKSNNAR